MFAKVFSQKYSLFFKPENIKNSSINNYHKNNNHNLTIKDEFVDFFSAIYLPKSKKELHELYKTIHNKNAFKPLHELNAFHQIKKLQDYSKKEYQNNYKAIFNYSCNDKLYVSIFYDDLLLKKKEIKEDDEIIEKFICDNFKYEYLFNNKTYTNIEELTKNLIKDIKDIVNYDQNVNLQCIYSRSSIQNRIAEIRNNIPEIKNIITKLIELDKTSTISLKVKYKNIYNENLSKLHFLLNKDNTLSNKQDLHALHNKIIDTNSNYISDYSNELILATKLCDFSVIGDINSILNRLSYMREMTENKKDLQKEIDNAITIANKWINLRNSPINSTPSKNCGIVLV
ncbi:hypothetical protein [Arsenophonus nasoniae]|uniref:hypothetical protein n=1 Tax=Arsenophonus nasoniae TaxID=638 RepID=UPI003879ECEA